MTTNGRVLPKPHAFAACEIGMEIFRYSVAKVLRSTARQGSQKCKVEKVSRILKRRSLGKATNQRVATNLNLSTHVEVDKVRTWSWHGG